MRYSPFPCANFLLFYATRKVCKRAEQLEGDIVVPPQGLKAKALFPSQTLNTGLDSVNNRMGEQQWN
jgi:hypothetical protein